MEIINVTDEIIEINVTEAVVNIVTQTGAYPLPSNVFSVFGRVGNVVGEAGDYTTSLVTEGTNLYYTNARSRAAISETITGINYDNTSGIFSMASGYSIPTDSTQATWTAAYNDKINSASVSGTTTKVLTLNQQDGGTITASWTDDNTDAVTSVFGRTGAIISANGDYTTSQVTEGSNLYFTNARVYSAISGTAPISEVSGVISIAQSNTTTDGYLSSTDWNTFNNKQPLITAGTTDQYYRGDKTFQILNTSAVAEGTNLYYTDTRSRSAISENITGIDYSNATGVFSLASGYIIPTQAMLDAKQDDLNGTGIVKSIGGTISYLTDNTANWDAAYNDKINSAAVTGTSTKTLTLNQQDGGTITASWTDIDTGLTSVGLSMPAAFSVSGSPLTSNGTLIVTGAGAASQYVRGDGTLADFPTQTGGGSSVSYYLNSSVSQGTLGGVAYRQLSKNPVAGTGTDITASTNGYIASYITDANDPSLLEVPGGNFNCEFYFSVNSNNHNPYVYAELYKYDGTTFTLLGSSQAIPEYLTSGTNLNPYYFAIPVATASLNLTDRIAIRIYVNVDTRVVTLHTEDNHLCQVVTTFSKGMTTLNNLTKQVQYLTTGTSGTNFAIVSSNDTHTFNLPTASATNTGKLSSSDWSNFNTAYNDTIVSASVSGTTTKTLTLTQQDAGTITASWTDLNTDAVSSVFGRTGAVIAASGDYTTTQVTEGTNLYYTEARVDANANVAANTAARHSAVTLGTANGLTLSTQTLSLAAASTSTTGALTSTDWNTFNGKQAALNGTGFVKISGTTISYDNSTYLTTSAASATYQTILTNPVTGTGAGTTNTLPKFTGSNAIGNSLFSDNGTNGAFGGTNYSSGTGVRTFNITAPQFAGIAFWTSSGYSGDIFSYESTGNLRINADPTNTIAASNLFLAVDDITIATLNTTNVTLSRALSGTSASFSGSVTSTGTLIAGLANGNIRLKGSTDGFLGVGESDGTLYLRDWTTGARGLSILLSTGAATFSNSLTATEFLATSGAPRITMTPNAYGGSYRTILGTRGGAEGVLQLGNNNPNYIVAGNSGTGGSLHFYVNAISDFITSTNGTLALVLASSGTATFSSDVTSSGSGFQGRYSRIYEASGQRGGLYPYNVISGGGTDYSIGLFSESSMWFAAGGGVTKHLTITSIGRVGIGTSNPADKLVVSNNGAEGIEFGFDTGIPYLFGYNRSTSSYKPIAFVGSAGVGIGTISVTGTTKLRVINSSAVNGDPLMFVDNAVYNGIGIYSAGADGYNGAASVMILGRNSSTSRSINAGGTINASGADYAEYMTKAVEDTIAKGDIVGVDENGLLTNIFNNAKSFVVKSTDPSYVGGDTWGSVDDIGKLATDATDEQKAEHEAKLEVARAKVDRIAFSGQVPCNVYNAEVGDYIIPIELNGKISGQALSNPTFEQYQLSVGKVWKIMQDGRAWIAVKIG